MKENIEWEQPRDWDKVLTEHRERMEQEERELEIQRRQAEAEVVPSSSPVKVKLSKCGFLNFQQSCS